MKAVESDAIVNVILLPNSSQYAIYSIKYIFSLKSPNGETDFKSIADQNHSPFITAKQPASSCELDLHSGVSMESAAGQQRAQHIAPATTYNHRDRIPDQHGSSRESVSSSRRHNNRDSRAAGPRSELLDRNPRISTAERKNPHACFLRPLYLLPPIELENGAR